jgi:hypothetical protein
VKTQYYAVISTVKGDKDNVVKTSLSREVTLGPSGSVIYMTGKSRSANWGSSADKSDFRGKDGFKFITDDLFEINGSSKSFRRYAVFIQSFVNAESNNQIIHTSVSEPSIQ